MRWSSVFIGALLSGSVLGAGCGSSAEPEFYTLFPGRGGAFPGDPLEVEVRRPGLPGYLDRPQIVSQAEPGKLEFSGAARWGAPLENLVGDVLAQNLAQRLPNARVFTESGAISSAPDAQVEIQIQRFELTPGGTVELIAQVAVHWPQALHADRIDRYALSRSPNGRGTSQVVAEMSGLLAELADAVAQSLRGG